MEPIDWVACTRSKVPLDSVRGYRIEGLSLEPHINLGDIIIVDHSMKPLDGDLVLVTTREKPIDVGIAEYKDGLSPVLIDQGGRHDLDAMIICGVITECVHRFRQA